MSSPCRYTLRSAAEAVLSCAEMDPRIEIVLGEHMSRDEYLARRSKLGSPAPGPSAIKRLGGWSRLLYAASQLHEPGEIEAMGLTVPAPVVPDKHRIKGVSTMVPGPFGKPQWVKTAAVEESKEELLARLLAELPSKVTCRSPLIPAPVKECDQDMLAVYPMGDPHLGMLAWGHETGGDNFNLEIAESLMKSAIDDLVAKGVKAAHALLVNLGDFFHADTLDAKTRRSGHALDVDSRWGRVYMVGVRVMRYLIDALLRHHETVKVVNEIGNHDDHTAFTLSVALDAFYHDNPRVEIDLSPARFHYHRFGVNLIGITHGHTTKHDSLESLMAHDRAADWGETKPQHRMWLCGHIHHRRVMDYRGCTVESFRTLAPLDAYAAEHGYRSHRDMNKIMLHREHGERARWTVSANYLKSLAGAA